MTQPPLNTTFDIPPMDLFQSVPQGPGLSTPEGSCSTTESALSESASSESDGLPAADAAKVTSEPSSAASHQRAESLSTKPLAQSIPTRFEFYDVSPTRRIQFIPTNTALYDAWSSVYDTDGNILQVMDDIELATLLPTFLALISPQYSERASSSLSLLDLGCGTGRNTLKLMTHPWPPETAVSITGLDASTKMLEIASRKLKACYDGLQKGQRLSYQLLPHDLLALAATSCREIGAERLAKLSEADAVVSTLVLEHFPLDAFFKVLRSLLKLNGVALVTNSHPEMSGLSQAGFFVTDEDGTEVKVRGVSWAYGVQETVDMAKKEGFELVGEVKERSVTEEMVEMLGNRARKWVGIRVWFGMLLRRVR